MKNEDKENSQDSETAHQSWSQVSLNKKNKFPAFILDKRLWVIGGVCLIILLMMIFSGGKKIKASHSQQPISMGSDNAQLNQNLEKIQSLSKEIQNNQKQLNANNSLLINDTGDQQSGFLFDKQNKALKARQNAPTRMFSMSANATGSSLQAKSQANNVSASSNTFAGQGDYASFGNQAMTTSSVTAKKIAHPPYTIASGEFLHAVLETAIDSDLPGEIRAVVSQPVYAYVGETPLIPAGSRLIGQYSSSTLQGQNRVFVIWNRVILPNGVSAQINSPGTDQLGIAGQGADDANTHFIARFGESSLLSIIGAGAATGGVSTNDQYNSAAQYRSAISQSFQQAANNSLQSSLQIKPTLSVDQGAEINVFVAHDIDFYSVMKVS